MPEVYNPLHQSMNQKPEKYINLQNLQLTT